MADSNEYYTLPGIVTVRVSKAAIAAEFARWQERVEEWTHMSGADLAKCVRVAMLFRPMGENELVRQDARLEEAQRLAVAWGVPANVVELEREDERLEAAYFARMDLELDWEEALRMDAAGER